MWTKGLSRKAGGRESVIVCLCAFCVRNCIARFVWHRTFKVMLDKLYHNIILDLYQTLATDPAHAQV